MAYDVTSSLLGGSILASVLEVLPASAESILPMRYPISRSHSVASLRHTSETQYYRGLRSFREYAETESQHRNQSAVNAEGELWEQETLQLRVTPPMIAIDNTVSEDATKITLCSANRPGTLVEVRQPSRS